MWCDIFFNAATLDAVLDMQPHGDAGESGAAASEKNSARGARFDQFGPGGVEITFKDGSGCFADRDDTFFVSFADDTDEAGIEVQLLKAQGSQFGEAQPGGVSEFEDGIVAERFRSGPG